MGSAEGTTPSTRRPTSSALLALDLRQLLVQRLPVVENEMGPFEHALALRREPDIALAALDDGNPQLLLKLPDAPRKRGLRDIASRRRPGEMLLAGERREVLNLTDVHGRQASGEGAGRQRGGGWRRSVESATVRILFRAPIIGIPLTGLGLSCPRHDRNLSITHLVTCARVGT